MRARVKRYDARSGMTFWQKGICYLNADLAFLQTWETQFVMRGILSAAVIAGVLLHAEDVARKPGIALAMGVCWVMFVTVGRLGTLWNIWRRLFPFTPDELFRFEIKEKLTGSLWLLSEMGVLYGLAFSGMGLGWVSSIALACAASVAMWSLSVACSALLLALRFTSYGPFMAMLLLLLVPSITFDKAPAFSVSCINLLPPFGWVNDAISGVALGRVDTLWKAAIWLVLVAALPWSMRRIKRMHDAGVFRLLALDPRAQSRIRFPDSSSNASLEPAGWLNGAAGEPSKPPGIIDRIIRSRFSPEELDIADLLGLTRFNFTRAYIKLLIWLAMLFLAGWVFPTGARGDMESASSELGNNLLKHGPWAMIVPIVIQLVVGAVALQKGISFYGWFASPEWNRMPNTFFPFKSHRLFPVSYWDNARTVVKAFFVISILLIAPALLLAFCPAWAFLAGLTQQSPFCCVKFSVAMWLGSVFISCFALLPREQTSWRSYRDAFRDIGIGTACCGIGIAGILARWPWDCLTLPAACAIALGFLAFCGRGYQRGWRGSAPR